MCRQNLIGNRHGCFNLAYQLVPADYTLRLSGPYSSLRFEQQDCLTDR